MHVWAILIKFIFEFEKKNDTLKQNSSPILHNYTIVFEKDTDTFQSFTIKKMDKLFGKTVKLNFNGLTDINSLCSIYINKDAKKDRPNSCENYQTS